MMADYWVAQLERLMGGTIDDVLVDDGDSGTYYGLLVTMSDGVQRTIWFLRDEENNGPGSFQVEDVI